MNQLDKGGIDLYQMSKSESLRRDMRRVASQRHNPFIKNRQPDIDACMEFLMQYNEFISHEPRPFRKIIDTEMLL